MDLYDYRRQYGKTGLCPSDLANDPIDQLITWLDDYLTLDTSDPTAVVLATSNAQGVCSQRVVLLKKIERQGLVFYTNKNSRKAKEIQENDHVSLLFPWYEIGKQVSIKGRVKETDAGEDVNYFASRPIRSQLAAWASPQSQVLASREVLMDTYRKYEQKFAESVPLPENWGGYRVIPYEVEFWQGRDDRLHDRLVYILQPGGVWLIKRLAP